MWTLMFYTADSFTATYIYILGIATVNAKANVVLSSMHELYA